MTRNTSEASLYVNRRHFEVRRCEEGSMLGHKLLGNFSKLLTRFGQSFNFEAILYIKAIFCSNREPLLVYFSTTLSRNASYITSFDIFYQIIGSN